MSPTAPPAPSEQVAALRERRLYVLIATLGLEISRHWDEQKKRAAIPLTRDALRFELEIWKIALRHFQQQGWTIQPIEPAESTTFAGPGFYFRNAEFR